MILLFERTCSNHDRVRRPTTYFGAHVVVLCTYCVWLRTHLPSGPRRRVTVIIGIIVVVVVVAINVFHVVVRCSRSIAKSWENSLWNLVPRVPRADDEKRVQRDQASLFVQVQVRPTELSTCQCIFYREPSCCAQSYFACASFFLALSTHPPICITGERIWIQMVFFSESPKT